MQGQGKAGNVDIEGREKLKDKKRHETARENELSEEREKREWKMTGEGNNYEGRKGIRSRKRTTSLYKNEKKQIMKKRGEARIIKKRENRRKGKVKGKGNRQREGREVKGKWRGMKGKGDKDKD